MPGLVLFVLDAERGKPVQGMQIEILHRRGGDSFKPVINGITQADGCLRVDDCTALLPGRFRAVFQSAAYFSARTGEMMFPEVCIDFGWQGPADLVLPLLLTANGYTTYLGHH